MAAENIDVLPARKKAAILLLELGREYTAKILAMVEESDLQDISKEIATTKYVEPPVSNEVVKEFYNMYMARKYIVSGGLEYAKEVVTKALGPEKARKMIDRLMRMLEQGVGFEFLTKVDAKQIVKIIQNEHPQTIALIMAHLDPSQAAESMAALPEDLKAEVAYRIANLQDISPSVARTLSNVLEDRFEAVSSYGLEVGGVKSVAEIINRMDRIAAKATLDRLEKDDPELVAKIRDMMFVFEDIKNLDNRAIQEIVRRVDKKTLTLALKGADDELKERFFKNMSTRAADVLKEEMEYLGPVRLRDVEAAQHEVVQVVRQLEQEDIISLHAGEKDRYV